MARSPAQHLRSSRAPRLLVLLALLLGASSLGRGFQTDDHLIIEALGQGAGPFGLFRGDAMDLGGARLAGALPWWSSPDLQLQFLRPLASVTHWLDFALWGHWALPMHALNLVLYGLVVWVAATAFRCLLPQGPAALAALMFTLNESHAQSVGWISGRNTVLATLFSLLALLAHHRGRSGADGAQQALSVVWLVLALASGEAGAVAFAYLGAYALVLDREPLAGRLRSLAPHLIVLGLWMSVYLSLGMGARGGGWYRDFAGQPAATLLAGTADLPLWLLSLLGPSVVGTTLAVPPAGPRLWATVVVLPLVWLMWRPVLRSRQGRFFALSTCLGLLPLMTTVPQDRVLMGLSLAGFGCLALFLDHASTSASRALRLVGGGGRVVHLWLAAPLFLLDPLAPIERASSKLVSAWPAGPDRTAFLLNSPLQLLPMYADSMRTLAGSPPLEAMHQLYAGGSPLVVERLDGATLEMTVARGWGHSPLESIYTDTDGWPRQGQILQLAAMRVQVMETTDAGRPRRVRFRFPGPLEDRPWLIWLGTGPAPWRPPAVGTRLLLDPINLFRAM